MRACASLVLLCATAAPVTAQEPGVDFKFLADFGTGDASASGGAQSTQALEIPIAFWIKSLAEEGCEKRDFGLRFKVPVTLGLTDVRTSEDPDLENLKTVVVLPTAEFHVPLSPVWTLKPFVGLGAGYEFETGTSAGIGTTGVIGQALSPIGQWEAHYGAAVRYDADMGFDGTGFDAFGRLEIKADFRRELGASVRGHHLMPGAYAMVYDYWEPLTFESDLGSVRIDREYELGISFGTQPKPTVFGFRLPRIFVGYRFGENIEGFRITFSELF